MSEIIDKGKFSDYFNALPKDPYTARLQIIEMLEEREHVLTNYGTLWLFEWDEREARCLFDGEFKIHLDREYSPEQISMIYTKLYQLMNAHAMRKQDPK